MVQDRFTGNDDTIQDKNVNKAFLGSNYGNIKLSKQTELNSGMSIVPQTYNEYQQIVRNGRR